MDVMVGFANLNQNYENAIIVSKGAAERGMFQSRVVLRLVLTRGEAEALHVGRKARPDSAAHGSPMPRPSALPRLFCPSCRTILFNNLLVV